MRRRRRKSKPPQISQGAEEMGRLHLGLAVLIGMALGAVAAVVWQRSQDGDREDESAAASSRRQGKPEGAERITAANGGLHPKKIFGHSEGESDPLRGETHDLPPAEAEHVRAASRLLRDGKATSRERETMYDSETDVAVSGAMPGSADAANRNPIGGG